MIGPHSGQLHRTHPGPDKGLSRVLDFKLRRAIFSFFLQTSSRGVSVCEGVVDKVLDFAKKFLHLEKELRAIERRPIPIEREAVAPIQFVSIQMPGWLGPW